MPDRRPVIPLGREEICDDLRNLRLSTGSICFVQSSLRRVGPLADGAATVADALRDVLGPCGTVVVPTFTARNSTTTRTFRRRTAGFSPARRAAEEARIEAFDRLVTPAQDVGAFAEHIRGRPGSVRSEHPQTSFAAIGPAAAELVREHALDCHLGERSPLATLYAGDAIGLLLGVDLDVCTAFHLAEHRLPWPAPRRPYRAYVMRQGRRTRCDFVGVDADDSDFGRIGTALRTETSLVRSGRVGRAVASWFPLRGAVDFAVEWMSRWRAGTYVDRSQGVI